MDALGDQADALVKRYPGRVEALIWDGIITSERASLTWGLTALNYATRARDVLLEAEKLDPKALDAGAATSLGVLYSPRAARLGSLFPEGHGGPYAKGS